MAQELKDIYLLFNPDKPMLNDELIKYYVEIDQNETNINELKTRLEWGLDTREPIKLLFTGHRGSGKTTALKRLVTKLNERFFIVDYNAFDLLDNNDITYSDVLFSIITKILEKAKQDNIDLGKNLTKRAQIWGSSITRTTIADKGKEGGISVNIPLYFLEIFGKMKSETITREEIRKEIEPRVSELIGLIDDTVAEIEKTGKQVLSKLSKMDFWISSHCPRSFAPLHYCKSTSR
jgi:Cdc6-like AAA superfamily ATPase